MATVPETTAPRKAFRATLRDEAGTLAKVDGAIVFFGDDGQVIDVEPEDCVWLCLLGEIGVSEAQKLADTRHGNAPRICTTRLMEV